MSENEGMKTIRWSQEKNRQLQEERGLTFEMVLTAIKLVHPNVAKCPNQRMMIVRINNYAFLVPYIDSPSELFLKTIIPSRKATKKYLAAPKNND
ncbi:MAG: hypothetical protein GPJ21_16130 [Microcystis aeruginosa W13-11]|jgi:hypothetical protein|nr:hypothetical protein [Microcystis aeruginosa W13-11]